MTRKTMLVVVVEETDASPTIETTGETTSDVVRHIPIRNRIATMHRPSTLERAISLASWIARAS